MAEDIMRRLKKKIIFDPEIGLDRLCWVLDTFCPLCGQPLEVIFEEPPGELEVLEADQIPCDDCLEEAENDQLAEEILRYLFEDDHPKHNS